MWVWFTMVLAIAWVSYAWIWLTAEPWDSLTAQKWNDLKDYVDAAWGWGYIDWSDCEYDSSTAPQNSNVTISCTAWYTLVDHSCSVQWARNNSARWAWYCYLNWINSLYIANSYATAWNWAPYGSIKCCKYIAP